LALAKTDVSEEHIASIIKVKRISELVTKFVTANKTLFLKEPDGITSQKMAFFLVTAMKTLNLIMKALPRILSSLLYSSQLKNTETSDITDRLCS
jgi:hypothetical protein